MDGLRAAFYVSAAMTFLAAIASVMRGRHFIHGTVEAETPTMATEVLEIDTQGGRASVAQ
jgi:hypothetical protein